MAMSYWELTFFLSCLLIQLVPLTVAQFFPKEECISDRGNYTDNSTYQADLNSLLTSFSNNQVEYGFYNSSVGEVNGIGLCRGDLTPDTCRSCINSSSQDIRRLCPNYKEAVLYYDLCMLRYSYRPIFGTAQTSPDYALVNTQNFSDIDHSTQERDNLLLDLQEKAASGGPLRKYATNETSASSETIYALAQCTPDLEDRECSNCLASLINTYASFFKYRQGGRAMAPSCNYRYEIYSFYDPLPVAQAPSPTNSSPPPPNDATTGDGKSNRARTVIIIVIPTVVSVILISCICICIFLRVRKPKGKNETNEEILSVESLQFNLGPIRNATDNFSDSNKLGQGGFGAVYKAWRSWRDRSVSNLIDPSVSTGSRSEIMRCIHIGLLCVQENVADRPTMASVVLMLSSYSVTLPLPSQPAFFMHSSIDPEPPFLQDFDSGVTKSSDNASPQMSVNDVSITELHPR
ncbi:hypothetical protein VitviT2T_014830 [Vitis vinifera]|uniref:Gnk2-homologous domain-containing protein n=1 Tax=Vitis vinifera TaxID=29760 RepID=A0ABY9CQ13_VITVI|nr:hypothetical protein VitviT2T_014830 [Vitis vinifera]